MGKACLPVVRRRPAGVSRRSASATKKPPSANRPAPNLVKITRNSDVASSIRAEIAAWFEKEFAEPHACPFCGRFISSRRLHSKHAKSHLSGRLKALHETLASPSRTTHPVFAAVARSLRDSDVVCGQPLGGYAARACALLSKWTGYVAGESDAWSIFCVTGRNDRDLALVLTETGPEFRARGSPLKSARPFGVHYYTMGFANQYMRQLLAANGRHVTALREVKLEWQLAGCQVLSLANRHSQVMSGLALDLMTSAALADFSGKLKADLSGYMSFKAISIDATYKLALKVPGHTRTDRNNIVSVLGLHGEALALVPSYAERPSTWSVAVQAAVPGPLRPLVQHVSSDVVNASIVQELQQHLPGLQGVSLDPLHLAFSVDRHAVKRRAKPTLVGLVVRAIIGKFSLPDRDREREEFYAGGPAPVASGAERAFVQQIKDGSMRAPRAKAILEQVNPNVAMSNRSEFAKLLAAVSAMYPERLDVKYDKGTLRMQFVAACQPSRAEFYFNNIRFRARLPLAEERMLSAGTTRNEQVHAMLNAAYKSTTYISKEMLAAELTTYATAELVAAQRALAHRTSTRVQRADVRAFSLSGVTIFDDASWRAHLNAPVPSRPPADLQQRTCRALRPGPREDQEAVWGAIREKAKRGRARLKLYDMSTKKRPSAA